MKPHHKYFLLAALCLAILLVMVIAGYREKKCVHTHFSSIVQTAFNHL